MRAERRQLISPIGFAISVALCGREPPIGLASFRTTGVFIQSIDLARWTYAVDDRRVFGGLQGRTYFRLRDDGPSVSSARCVRQRASRVGDHAVIWQARDLQGRRGVIALGQIVEEPRPRSDAGNPYSVDSKEGTSIEERVIVRYVPLSEPLWVGGPHEQILAPLSVSRARGGTVFRVTPDQWKALAAFAAEFRRITNDLEYLRKTPTGQGFGLSAAQRKAVEDHAMALALAHYGTLWVVVDDVHSHESYDLKCRRGGLEHHVEVKGTTGPGNAVLPSKNEVQHARDFFPNVSLFVVSEIPLDEDDKGRPIATGGHIRILEPWRVADCTLVALTYQCSLLMSSTGGSECSIRTDEGLT